jgi:hypothetical protein
MAFHFEKPSGFKFKAGQCADVTLTDPRKLTRRETHAPFLLLESNFKAGQRSDHRP